MFIRSLVAAAALYAASAHSAVLVSESFDDIGTLAGSGWVLTNASIPVGTGGWFQGNEGIFGSQSGAASSYIGSSYLAGAVGGTLANWLISPTFSTAVAGTVSFWARAEVVAPYFDQIAAGFSSGSSAVSAFTPASAVTLGGAWTQYSYSFAAQGAGSVARFAIDYSGLASNANHIGIDTFEVATPVAAVPEPSTYFMLALGLAGVGLLARRRSS